MKNCIKTPNLVCGCLKLFFDCSRFCGITAKESLEFLEKLFRLFFVYFLSVEFQLKLEAVQGSSTLERKTMVSSASNDLKEVEAQHVNIRKMMKHLLFKYIYPPSPSLLS